MGNRIIITKNGDKLITALFSPDELLKIQADREGEEKTLGNIYVGRVKNIVKNINAAFVEIEDGRICYLPIDEKAKPIFANDNKKGKIREGDELIVQVVREDKSKKAPVATVDFSLTGKYVVLSHGAARLGMSAKITDEEKRKELKELLAPYIKSTFGIIARTNCQDAEPEQIIAEVERLESDYRSLVDYGVHFNCFTCLYQAPPTYLWEVRDGYTSEIEEIKTDVREVYENIRDYMNTTKDRDIEKLVFYEDESLSLDALYGISNKLQAALTEKVWLDSGAYLVINETEAMNVIDVNTGKAIKSRVSSEEQFFRINREAAKEIAKQIRLRNLSGIIIVDFIDMEDDEHKQMLLEKLDKLLKKDPIKTTVVDMTALGLVEITRKKVRKPLSEQVKC